MFHVKHGEAPPAPDAAAAVFGERLSVAVEYAAILAGAGIERGLIGPGEVDRLWDRHILNSAAIGGAHERRRSDRRRRQRSRPAGGFPPCSGAAGHRSGSRRAAVAPRGLSLGGRGTAWPSRYRHPGDGRRRGPCERRRGEIDVVTSRAVAALDKLTRWCLPLLRTDGRMLAMKGERAADEINEHRRAMSSLGAVDVRVMECGVTYLTPPVTVVVAVKASRPVGTGGRSGGPQRKPARAQDRRTARPDGPTRRSK